MPSRILVVEDDPSIAELIRTVLQTEGYTVAVAPDGAQGLMLARDWSPDLILMDVIMPDVDGSTIIRHLKSDAATASIPIVAMSAGANLRDRVTDLQADAVLAKPFDLQALLVEVSFRLARRHNDA